MIQKTEAQRKEIRSVLGSGEYHPDSASIFHNQKPADYWALKESIRKIPLSEFLGKQGLAGVDYLVPDKLYDTLIFYSKETDKVPIISIDVAQAWKGGNLTVDIVNDETYKPHKFASGGYIPDETVETTQATLDPLSFGINIRMGTDLIEDGQWEMVEYHVRQAAKAMGEYATSLAIAVLMATAPGASGDGWGNRNGGDSTNTGEMLWMGGGTWGISEAIDANLDDGWISNTIITNGDSWTNSISETLPVGSTYMPVKPGFTHCVNDIDILLHTNATDLTSTRLCTLVFDRNNALLTGRKRWMQVENYANPIADLAGAVVTARQDSVSVYDDAICRLREGA